MKSRGVLLLLLVALLTVACQESEPAPTVTPEPTEILPTAVSPTAEPATATPVDEAESGLLLANPWQWMAFTGAVEAFEIQSPASYRVAFNADGTLNVQADCNSASGSYTDDAGSLTINIGPSTLAACPPGSRSDQFIQFLGSAVRYTFDGDNLLIELVADGGTLTLAPADAIASVPTVAPPTATPVPPTAVPATATPLPPTSAPSLPGSVVDGGPRTYATGTYQAPIYTVAAGDTLFSIAQRFGVSVEQLSAANGITNSAIFAGQQLVIAQGDETAGPPPVPPAQEDFERVAFEAGAISATLNGTIVQGAPQGYVLRGGAGQVLEIGTTSSGVPLEVSVQTEDGRVLPLNGENQQVANNLFLPLPASTDYYVTVRPATPPEGPGLNFTITFVIQ